MEHSEIRLIFESSKDNKLIFTTKFYTMYSKEFLKKLYLIGTKEMNNCDVVFELEHEETEKIYLLCISHDYLREAIEEFVSPNVEVRITREEYADNGYQDIAESIWSEYQEKGGEEANGDPIMGCFVKQVPSPIWLFTLPKSKNGANLYHTIPRTAKDCLESLNNLKAKIGAISFRPSVG